MAELKENRLFEDFKQLTKEEQNLFFELIKSNEDVNISDYEPYEKVVTFRSSLRK